LIDFRPQGDSVALIHTEIAEAHAGQGLAAVLVRKTLQQIKDAGQGMLPYCPYVRGYLDKHPEWVSLVPSDQWEKFDLI
jgi:predicted GNAT family acetyltransferase